MQCYLPLTNRYSRLAEIRASLELYSQVSVISITVPKEAPEHSDNYDYVARMKRSRGALKRCANSYEVLNL